MTDLIVKRVVAKRDLFRRYSVEVDGSCAGHIRAGGATHIRLSDGMRRICLSIDGYSSGTLTILGCSQQVAIVECAPAEILVAPTRSNALSFKFTANLPADRTSYIQADLVDADDVARAFLRSAWAVARFQMQERAKPGKRSRYGLTAGDLSILYHGCRTSNARMTTRRGSSNDLLWSELTRIGWLGKSNLATTHGVSASAYSPTDIGRIELLEIFSGGHRPISIKMRSPVFVAVLQATACDSWNVLSHDRRTICPAPPSPLPPAFGAPLPASCARFGGWRHGPLARAAGPS